MSQCPESPASASPEAGAEPLYARLRIGKRLSLLEKATAFLDLLEREEGGPGVSHSRRSEILRDIKKHRFYEHTPDELLWGCRFAWRHSVRCIGRYFWKQLEVRDERHVHESAEVAASCFEHLRVATNGGAIRPLVTVFPAQRGRAAWRIWNYQLVRYAGYRAEDGEVLGDPAEAEFTASCLALGWVAPRTRGPFDVLPLVISAPGSEPEVFPVPPETVLEVPLEHPDFRWFKELRLRWYAMPVVSNMLLEIGGIRYPSAPFNGWYMGTEIGARNLADWSRYNLLPEIAERMGIFEKRETSLWRDRALVELNRAVLYSYKMSGVRMIDHHTASQLHVRFEEDETASGRPVTGRWDWLVPPVSGSTSPLWSRSYDPTEYSPNFLNRENAT
jgi:nitric-oxide synthase